MLVFRYRVSKPQSEAQQPRETEKQLEAEVHRRSPKNPKGRIAAYGA